MGNRAVIAFSDNPNATGIYVHWNGGRASVEGFLDAAKKLGVSGGDEQYALARLTQIIGNFFGGTSSVGIGPMSTLDTDNYDNGTYILGADLSIVKRLHTRARAEEFNADKTETISKEIVEAQKSIFKKEV